MSESETETVFVTGTTAGKGTRTAHLYRDCKRLKQAKKVYEKDREVLFDEQRICETCKERLEIGKQ